MKKNKLLIVLGIFVLIVIFVIAFFCLYDKKEDVNVKLIDNLDVTFDSKKHLSDFIASINGKLIKNEIIDTTKLGSKKIKFKYINEDGKKVSFDFKINVIDDVPPYVRLKDTYSVTTNYDSTLEHDIICVDNYDDNPNCIVQGEYDTKVPGDYSLTFVATDMSGNKTTKPFVLHVSEPGTSSSYEPEIYDFEQAKKDLGGEGVKFGIDVSSWQGELDFETLKNAGVEFAFVRVGSKWISNREYFLDSQFERNMEGFNKVNIPVGAYFYSYARDEKEAKEDALWVVDKLKKYKIDLPVAFDFEDWADFNDYNMSLYKLNRNASVFIETLESFGYEGCLYGSVSYMDDMWKTDDKTIWVAHWTNNESYKDQYKYWQFSAYGKVPGISGYTDLDIMYE